MAICDNPDCAVELENPIIVNEFTSCVECEYIFEEVLRMDDRAKPTRRKCPECGRKKVKQVILGAPSMVDSVNISVTKPDNSFSEVIAKINEKEIKVKV